MYPLYCRPQKKDQGESAGLSLLDETAVKCSLLDKKSAVTYVRDT